MGGIEHELLLTVSFRIDRSHPGDGATIGGRQGSLSARSVHLKEITSREVGWLISRAELLGLRGI